jgi:hypothetical protein
MDMKGNHMTDQNRQREAQAIAEPMLEETIARMSNAGLQGHEIAQALVLTGAGLLAGSVGPKGAGHDLRAVAKSTAAWMTHMADQIETKAN